MQPLLVCWSDPVRCLVVARQRNEATLKNGQQSKAGRRKAATPKRSVPTKTKPGRSMVTTGQETDVARLTRERDEAAGVRRDTGKCNTALQSV